MGGQMWVSAAGLEAGSSYVDTLAQDIANVDTAGFKALLPVDGASAPQPVYPAGLTAGPAAPAQVLGLGGAALQAQDVNWGQGSVAQTGDPLNVAILGPGLFMLRDGAGKTVYTRAGDFQLDGAGQLTDPEGRLVLDQNGRPITVPAGATNVQIAPDGTVTALTSGSSLPTAVGRIGLAFPTAPQGMAAAGFGTWTAPAAAGAVAVAAPNGSTSRLESGALEQSNADLTALLPDLVAAQQAYAVNARAESVAAALWQTVNGLKV